MATLEKIMAPDTMMRSYLLSFVFVPTLVAVGFAWVMNRGTTLERQVIGVVVGYNVLATVTWMTVAAIVVVGIVALTVYLGMLAIGLDLKRVFGAIAVWAGFGTAAGFVAAALLPVVTRVMGFSATHADGALPPELLIEVPAAGAVMGYAVGLLVAVVAICGDARNLVLRRFVAPLMFILVLAWLTEIQFGPRSIVRGIVDSAPALGPDACSDLVLEQQLGEPASVMQVLAACDRSSTVVDEAIMLWFVGIGIAVVAAAAFWRDFRRRFDAAITT